MNASDLLPAIGLTFLVVGFMAATKLLPVGTGLVLVKTGTGGVGSVLGAPALADVALVGLPAPGYAVLRGTLG